MQDKCADQTERDTEDPCPDQVDHHYILCPASAADDTSSDDHILNFKRRDHGVGKKYLDSELLYGVFDLIDFNIISACRDNQQGKDS